jgi:beta-glucosidase
MTSPEVPPFRNPDLPVADRVRDLLSRMTLLEKASQMLHDSPALKRHGIPAYNWWNECLHGVARGGIATVFPQAIGMAASWDTELLHRVGVAVSDEARAKYHEAIRRDDVDMYKGLTYWTPNINIFRDPRWGRGHETYGECPHLTGRMGVTYIQALQGSDRRHLKLAATAKHFAVHSGPEKDRHGFNVDISPKDLRETYLPHFKAAVQEAGVAAIMSAYNRLNGEPCSSSAFLLEEILRKEWGFTGHVVSDCGAVEDIHDHHGVTKSMEQSAARAVKNGCDLNCGCSYARIPEAVKQGLLTEADVDKAVARLLDVKIRLGMFDPPERVSHASIPIDINDCEAHRALAREAARKTIVLLKNDGGLLPLKKNLKCVAVIGPNADAFDALLGNYHGTPSLAVTPLAGIREKLGKGVRLLYAPGCDMVPPKTGAPGKPTAGFTDALVAAERADVVIMCLGLSPVIEGEQGDAYNSEAAGDRIDIGLPGQQDALLKAVAATGKPIVVVLLNGGGVTVNWVQENIPAILTAGYPGEEGGSAIADVLFGDYNPAGRLATTWVKSVDQLPHFEDYRMTGRTYRFLREEPLYPFGFGLSYTSFAYSDLSLSGASVAPGATVAVRVKVRNLGPRAGEEVVQLYLTDEEASVAVPVRQLCGFRRIALEAGEEQVVSFEISARQMALIDEAGNCLLEPGRFTVAVGGSQPDARSRALGAAACVTGSFEVTGRTTPIPY